MPTYPINFTSATPSSERLTLVNKQSVQASPYSGATSVVNNYSYWTLELNFPRMSTSRAMAHSAWLDSLNGSTGTFLYTPMEGVVAIPRTLTLAAGAFPMSNIINVAGFQADAATGLMPGQFISIGDQLLRVSVAPAIADAQGRAIVEFNPPLRTGKPTGTTVATNNPRGTFRLMLGEAGAGYQVDFDRAPEFSTLVAVEAL